MKEAREPFLGYPQEPLRLDPLGHVPADAEENLLITPAALDKLCFHRDFAPSPLLKRKVKDLFLTPKDLVQLPLNLLPYPRWVEEGGRLPFQLPLLIAQPLLQGPVDDDNLQLRVKDEEKIVDRIEEGPEVLFTFLNKPLRLFPLGNITGEANGSQNFPLFTKDRGLVNLHPLLFLRNSAVPLL